MNNHSWKQFAQSNSGSVSVYLIVILVPIFLFNAVLIDYARVLLAEREAEMAVKTGLRSVLSGFDKHLQPYGLYALEDEAGHANSLFGDIIRRNLVPEAPGTYTHFLDQQLKENTNSLKAIYTLANQTVFHQQILDEMKYMAPLEYTIELVNKFKKTEISNPLNATKQFSDHAEQLESLLEQRNQALDEAWVSSTQLLQHAEALTLDYNQQVDDFEDLSEEKMFREKEDILRQLSTDHSNLMNNYTSIFNEIDKAEVINKQLYEEKIKLTRAAETSEATISGNTIFNSILVYDVNYFSLYRTELSKTLALFSGLQPLLDFMPKSEWSSFFKSWNSNSDVLLQQIQSFKQTQGKKELQRQQKENQKQTSMNEQRNKLNQVIESAKGGDQGCSLLTEDTYSQSYKMLNGDSTGSDHGFYAKYQSYNKNSEEIKQTELPYKLESGEKTSRSSLNWIQQFSGLADDFRDELYLNEYVLNKFNYRTLPSDSPKSSRSLNNQEVEYILYGLSSCTANYTAAYSEMYVMLLAIRTMEALFKPQNELLNMGSPLLVFLAAAAQGAIEAWNDLNKLLKGEAIPVLRKSPKLTIDYKQLLRIFLLLHSNEERMMSRMQALIELETGSSLMHKATYIQGRAVITLRLWFGFPICRSTNNRCEMNKMAVMAY